MITEEQEKTLVELGFEPNPINRNNWIKLYRKRGFIMLYSNCVRINQVKSCKEAQHDLAILREKGIV